MSEIEKIKRYIERTEIPQDTKTRYDLRGNEFVALYHNVPAADTLYLAYLFGRARGYRAAQKEAINGS